MSKYKVRIDKDRIAEARDRMEKFYHGKPVDYVPFMYGSGTADCPHYNHRDMITNLDKAVEQTIARINAQTDAFPDTDFLPYFNFAFLGEGVVASMFGAKQYIVDDNPPYTEGRVLNDIYDLDKLKTTIDPNTDGWGPILKDAVMKFMDATHGEIPVGVSDHQSPYGTATKIMNNENLMYAMYDEPEMVHKFFDIVTTGIEKSIDTMKSWVGEGNLVENCNIPVPGKTGLILWDDYISVITPDLHTEFCEPYNKRLYKKYGRGHLHTCGPYFDGYLDACLACDPISLDFAIMRGFTRSRKDMLEFRRITREAGIILCGSPSVSESHIFENKWEKIDDDFLREMMRGGIVYSEWGAPENGKAATERWKRLCNEIK